MPTEPEEVVVYILDSNPIVLPPLTVYVCVSQFVAVHMLIAVFSVSVPE